MEDKAKLDQHFLKDTKVIKEIVKTSKLNSKDIVLEIGPGKGILTKELSKKTKKVITVEIDRSLKPYLESLPENVEIMYENILSVFEKIKFNKIISNIPYSISEPLLKKMLKYDFELAVLLVGIKFSNLLLNKGSKWNTIGKIFFNIKKVADVPKTSFEPKPRTNSAIILFSKRKLKLSKKEKILREFILQDDKKAKNALLYAIMRIEKITKRNARGRIDELKIPPSLFEKNIDYLSNRQFDLLCSKLGNLEKSTKIV